MLFNLRKKIFLNFLYFLKKFELLIYDWILSGQTHLWTHHKLYELDLFNKSLSKFKSLIVNYPQLSYKVVNNVYFYMLLKKACHKFLNIHIIFFFIHEKNLKNFFVTFLK